VSRMIHSLVRSALLVVGATVLLSTTQARAHHSHAMFDLEKEKTVTGAIKAFVFTNPHVYLYVNVTDKDSGETKTYIVEMSHVQNMMSRGIRASTFAPGDNITVTMNPLRDGRPGGNYVNVIDKNGKQYGGREEAAAALANENAAPAAQQPQQ
jgi:hypothetical protein